MPTLRFPEFSGEWIGETIGGIATLAKGVGISKDQLTETGAPCILYGELYTKYKSEIINEICSKTDIATKGLVHSKNNDVIIPSSGETAIDIATARCVLKENVLLGGDLNVIRLQKHDGRFVSYQLNGKRRFDIAKVAQGVSVVHLYGESIKGIKIYCPNLAEQEKIAHLLSLLDERIATQNKIIEDYETLIQALCDRLTNDSRSKVLLSFNDFGTAYSGLSGKCADDFGEGLPYVTYLNVYQNNIIDTANVGLVKIDKDEQQSIVRYGDVLFTLSSETPEEVGMGAVYLSDTQPMYLNSFCFGVHITSTEKYIRLFWPIMLLPNILERQYILLPKVAHVSICKKTTS